MNILWFCLMVLSVLVGLDILDRRRKAKRMGAATKRASERRIMAPPEGSTSEDQKRLMEQTELGDPIWDGILRDWRRNCSPTSKEPKRNSNAGGAYIISVGDDVEITVDLRRPQGKVVSIEIGGVMVTELPEEKTFLARRVLDEYRIFDVLA